MTATALDLLALLATDVGFIDFDKAAIRTERRQIARAHGFTNAMRQKPSALVLHFEHAA